MGYRIGVADVECSILSSFLSAPLMNDMEDIFTLNQDYFTTEFRKRVAKNINESVKKETLGMLDTFLEDKIIGTAWEISYLDILGQTPMPISLAKQYHDDFLRMKYNENLIKGLI